MVQLIYLMIWGGYNLIRKFGIVGWAIVLGFIVIVSVASGN